MAVSVTTIKKYLQIDLGNFLKKYNFKARRIGGDIFFSKKENEMGYSFFAQVLSNGSLSLHAASMCYYEVERIIATMANYEMIEYEAHPYLTTLRLFYPQTSTIVESEDDFYRIITEFEISFTDYYLPTFEKYSDPKNILELWDSLDDKINSNQFPSPLNLVKIMILSKMSKEDKYEQRCQEAIDYYQFKIASGKIAWKEELEICYKVIKYLSENEV